MPAIAPRGGLATTALTRPHFLLLYAAMNFVVLPLSAAGMPSFANHAWVGASIVAHALLGVVCALFARIAAARM